MSRMNDSEGTSTDKIKDTAQQVSQNLRDLGSQARDVATDKYNDLKDQANAYVDKGREYVEKGKGYYDEKRAQAAEWEQGIEQYVQEKPIQSLLIAGGIGVVLGLLWKRS